jgi:hypothetical protein
MLVFLIDFLCFVYVCAFPCFLLLPSLSLRRVYTCDDVVDRDLLFHPLPPPTVYVSIHLSLFPNRRYSQVSAIKTTKEKRGRGVVCPLPPRALMPKKTGLRTPPPPFRRLSSTPSPPPPHRHYRLLLFAFFLLPRSTRDEWQRRRQWQFSRRGASTHTPRRQPAPSPPLSDPCHHNCIARPFLFHFSYVHYPSCLPSPPPFFFWFVCPDVLYVCIYGAGPRFPCGISFTYTHKRTRCTTSSWRCTLSLSSQPLWISLYSVAFFCICLFVCCCRCCHQGVSSPRTERSHPPWWPPDNSPCVCVCVCSLSCAFSHRRLPYVR